MVRVSNISQLVDYTKQARLAQGVESPGSSLWRGTVKSIRDVAYVCSTEKASQPLQLSILDVWWDGECVSEVRMSRKGGVEDWGEPAHLLCLANHSLSLVGVEYQSLRCGHPRVFTIRTAPLPKTTSVVKPRWELEEGNLQRFYLSQCPGLSLCVRKRQVLWLLRYLLPTTVTIALTKAVTSARRTKE